ncbi:MAG: hypothetical protein ACOC9Z_08285 [Chloroflexota bacterium]
MAKRITTKDERLEPTANAFAGGRDVLVATYRVLLRGLCQHMSDDTVMAIFGSFERVGQGLVEYSATVWADHGVIYHNYHSEFLDDLAWLQGQ